VGAWVVLSRRSQARFPKVGRADGQWRAGPLLR